MLTFKQFCEVLEETDGSDGESPSDPNPYKNSSLNRDVYLQKVSTGYGKHKLVTAARRFHRRLKTLTHKDVYKDPKKPEADAAVANDPNVRAAEKAAKVKPKEVEKGHNARVNDRPTKKIIDNTPKPKTKPKPTVDPTVDPKDDDK